MTNAELCAYTCGMRIAEWAGIELAYDPTDERSVGYTFSDDEILAQERLGNAVFAYWAARGAKDYIDQHAPAES